jgi:hypothetical protein
LIYLKEFKTMHLYLKLMSWTLPWRENIDGQRYQMHMGVCLSLFFC